MTQSLLNRAKAAKFLGISLSEFKRREKAGIYRPTLVDDRGWHMYAVDDLNRVRKGDARKKTVPRKPPVGAEPEHTTPKYPGRGTVYEPEVAAKVFTELDNGMTARDIVKILKVHPDVVYAIYEAWTKLGAIGGGGFHLTRVILDAINELPLLGILPVLTGEELLACLRETALANPLCVRCEKRPQQICLACAAEEETPRGRAR